MALALTAGPPPGTAGFGAAPPPGAGAGLDGLAGAAVVELAGAGEEDEVEAGAAVVVELGTFEATVAVAEELTEAGVVLPGALAGAPQAVNINAANIAVNSVNKWRMVRHDERALDLNTLTCS